MDFFAEKYFFNSPTAENLSFYRNAIQQKLFYLFHVVPSELFSNF
jgi:hypothetical protein